MQPDTLGTAYARLRATIDDLVLKLGGDNFACSVVTVGARDAFRFVMPASWRLGFKSHMSYCEPLTASTAQLQAATEHLARVFSVRETSEDFGCTLGRGRLVVRGLHMFFETEGAAVLFAHAYAPSGSSSERWTVATTSEAETWLLENNLPKPSVAMTHTKTEDAAKKAFHRIAQQHFRVLLVAPAVPG